MSRSPETPPKRFGFVVHPLTPFQRRLLGVRSLDGPLAVGRTSRRGSARVVAKLALRTIDKQDVNGTLCSIAELPEELLSDQGRGVSAIIDAVRLCEAGGSEIVGLGAVAAMIGGQGKSVAAAVNVPITTGNALTALTACETVELLIKRLGGRRRLFLLGPPGPVANAILEVLVSHGHEIFVVSPRTPRPLERLVAELNQTYHGRAVLQDSMEGALGDASILIAASSTGGRLRLSQLPEHSIVVDVAEPLDVQRDIGSRKDVLVLEGEYLRTPQALRGGFWRKVYGLITAQNRHIYACFAEPMLLALAGRPELCSVGRKVPRELLEELPLLMSRYGFWVDTLFEAGRPLWPGRLDSFRQLDDGAVEG